MGINQNEERKISRIRPNLLRLHTDDYIYNRDIKFYCLPRLKPNNFNRPTKKMNIINSCSAL
jgi:hypothetical protein